MKRFLLGGVLLLAGLAILAAGSVSHAREDYLPIPKPLGGAVKFRVDKSNADKYKDMMPAGLYQLIKEWGYSANVYDTVNDFSFPKEYQEMTEKNKGKARINKRGGIENYAGGLPFPEPKTAAEIMWDYEYKYLGDDFYYVGDVSIMATTGRERKLGLNYARLAYESRIKLDPKPSIPDPNHIEIKEISRFTYPEDIAGMALLTARYQDPSKGDDGWMYIPTIRRVRRISVAQRGDSSGGMDFTWDDYRGFSGKVSDYTWKLVGKKEMIVPFHAPTHNPKRKGIMFNPDDVRYELRTVWIVDGVNVDKSYVYSKRRSYVDTHSYDVIAADLWDRKNVLWKYIDISNSADLTNHISYTVFGASYDLIAHRCTLVYNIKCRLNSGLKEAYFTSTNLQTTSR